MVRSAISPSERQPIHLEYFTNHVDTRHHGLANCSHSAQRLPTDSPCYPHRLPRSVIQLQWLASHQLTILTDDFRVLVAARQEARRQFDEHRREGIDTPMQINHAKEVAAILRHNIVQGVRDSNDEDGKWGAYCPMIDATIAVWRDI